MQHLSGQLIAVRIGDPTVGLRCFAEIVVLFIWLFTSLSPVFVAVLMNLVLLLLHFWLQAPQTSKTQLTLWAVTQ